MNTVPIQEPTPDWQEVRQSEDYSPVVVSVKNVGVSNVRPLPAKRSVMRQIRVPYFGDVNSPPPIEIIPGDPRIKNVWLQASGNNPGDIFMGTYEQVKVAVTATTDAFRLFSSDILGPLQGFEDSVYAYASVAGTNILSVRIEYWAD